ncbi:MGMT family protein [Halorubrum luteum]
MVSMGTSGVFARAYDELDAAVEVGFAGGRVIAVSFPATPPDDAAGDHQLLDRIGAYLRGEPDEFTDVAIGLTVPTDQRAVLEALRDVPYGEAVSVSRVTRLAALDDNDPDDLDLVKRTLRENPVPLLIPDHRVQGGPYATPAGVRDTIRRLEEIGNGYAV